MKPEGLGGREVRPWRVERDVLVGLKMVIVYHRMMKLYFVKSINAYKVKKSLKCSLQTH